MRFKALFISPAMLVGLFFFLIVIHSLYKKQLKLCLENSISDFSYNREIRFTNGACTIVYNLVCTTIISNLVMIKVAKKKKSIYIYIYIHLFIPKRLVLLSKILQDGLFCVMLWERVPSKDKRKIKK